MSYSEEVIIGENTYNFSFVTDNLTLGYENIIISKNGNLSCNWVVENFSEIQSDLETITQKVVDYILREKPSKFCFMSPDLQTFDLYKSFYNQFSDFYIQRQRKITLPIDMYICFYDII